MTTYGGALRGVAAAAGAPYWTFNAGSTRRAKMRELGIFTTAATPTNIAFGHPANEGTPPVATGAVTPVPFDPADTAAAVARLAAAWSTAPTAPTVALKSCTLGAAVGAGLIWKHNVDELPTLGLSGWVVLFNPAGGAAGAILDVYVHFEE